MCESWVQLYKFLFIAYRNIISILSESFTTVSKQLVTPFLNQPVLRLSYTYL